MLMLRVHCPGHSQRASVSYSFLLDHPAAGDRSQEAKWEVALDGLEQCKEHLSCGMVPMSTGVVGS